MSAGGGGTGFNVNITGNSGSAQAAVRGFHGQLRALQQITETSWWGIHNLGLAFAALPAAMGAGIGFAIKATSDWEDAMFAVRRTAADLGDQELDRLERRILDLARVVPIATAELAELVAQGAALGIDGEEALAKFANTMGTLIASTNVTKNNVSDVARVLNVLDVPEEQFDNFASGLIEVGRRTAATETEIINMARRLAAAGRVAGLTTGDILGLSAAVLSLGSRAEAGSSAVIRSLQDMARAVVARGPELEIFADVANMSVEAFIELFQRAPREAFGAFLTGLGALEGGLTQTTQVLDGLGITEVRQVQALQQLAVGTRNVGSEQSDVNEIMRLANQAILDNTALSKIQEDRLNTLSSQMQILKNVVFEAGASFGDSLLPYLKAGVGFLQLFVGGISALPGPVKAVIAIFGALVGLITSLGAVAFLLGPRIIIAATSFQRLFQSFMAARSGAQQLTLTSVALGRQIQTAGQLSQQSATQINAINNSLANYKYNATQAAIATQNLAVAQQQSAAASQRFWFWMRTIGASTAGFILGSVIAAKHTAELGRRQIEAAEAAEKLRGPNNDLVRIWRNQGAAGMYAAKAYIAQTEEYRKAKRAADDLGISSEKLLSVVTGDITGKDFQAVLDSLEAARKKQGQSSQSADQLTKSLDILRSQWRASVGEAGLSEAQLHRNADALKAEAQAAQESAEKYKERQKVVERQAQATLDYYDAVLASKAADIELEEAEKALAEAKLENERRNEKLLQLENAVAEARRGQTKAARDVQSAERGLADARGKDAEAVADAEDSLADARSRQKDLQDSIIEKEEALSELRAENWADKITEAEEKLANARVKQGKATLDIQALEYHLGELRSRGAGAADIARAELALQSARNGLADANRDVKETEEEIEDLKDPVKRARALDKAERDLADTRRELAKSGRDITEREKALADARRDLAENRSVVEAEEKLADARSAQVNANQRVLDAERELDKFRKENPADAITKAELALEQQIYRTAQAHVEVTKQAALMRGEEWDARDTAVALNAELDKMAGKAPTEKARNDLRQYQEMLKNTPELLKDQPPLDVGEPDLASADEFGEKTGDAISEAIRKALGDKGPEKIKTGFNDILVGFLPFIGAALGPVLAKGVGAAFNKLPSATVVRNALSTAATSVMGALGTAIQATGAALGKALTFAWEVAVRIWRAASAAINAAASAVMAALGAVVTATGAALGAALSAAWGIAVAIWAAIAPIIAAAAIPLLVIAIVAALILFFTKTEIGRKIVDIIFDGIKAAGEIFAKIGIWLYDHIIQPIWDLMKDIYEAGKDIVGKIWDGITWAFGVYFGFYKWIWDHTLGALIGFLPEIFEFGKKVVGGIWDGIVWYFKTGFKFYKWVWDNTIGKLDDLYDAALGMGKNLVIGLWNGIINPGFDFAKKIIDWVEDHIPGPIKKFLELFSPSRYFSRMGQNITLGLIEGIEGETPGLKDAVDAMIATMAQEMPTLGFGLDVPGGSVAALSGASKAVSGASGTGETNIDQSLTQNIYGETDPEANIRKYLFHHRVRSRGA